MIFSDFKYPCRAWINQPSTLQPMHNYHGMRGIAIVDPMQSDAIRIYFSEGELFSMQVDPKWLSSCN
jgi:hypothetical protein